MPGHRGQEHVISHSVPALAVSVAVHDRNRFLLVKRKRPPAEGLFAFPGGRVEPGEAIAAAAHRELLEETGLAVAKLELHDTIVIEPEGTDGTAFALSIFRGTGPTGLLMAGDDAEAAGWYTLEEMASLPVTVSTLDIARRLAGRDATVP